jgi:hypothetical protein
MRGAIPPLLRYVSMAWCSVKKSTETALPLPLPFTPLKTGVRELSYSDVLVLFNEDRGSFVQILKKFCVVNKRRHRAVYLCMRILCQGILL